MSTKIFHYSETGKCANTCRIYMELGKSVSRDKPALLLSLNIFPQ